MRYALATCALVVSANLAPGFSQGSVVTLEHFARLDQETKLSLLLSRGYSKPSETLNVSDCLTFLSNFEKLGRVRIESVANECKKIADNQQDIGKMISQHAKGFRK